MRPELSRIMAPINPKGVHIIFPGGKYADIISKRSIYHIQEEIKTIEVMVL